MVFLTTQIGLCRKAGPMEYTEHGGILLAPVLGVHSVFGLVTRSYTHSKVKTDMLALKYKCSGVLMC